MTRTRPPDDDSGVQRLPRTIAELPFFASGRHPKPDLIGQCRGGEVHYTSGRDLLPKVRDIGLGLAALGMTAGSRVAILAESRPEWLFVDLAVLAAGAVSTPVYPTLTTEQVRFILRDAGTTIVVVSTAEQLQKVVAIAGDLPDLRAIVTMDGSTAGPLPGVRLVSLEEVAAIGHDRIRGGWGVAREFHDAARRVRPSDLAAIIYTSGTTADPKGVMLTHGNLVSNLQGVLQVLDLFESDVALSFLPLCHAFERMVAYIYLTVGISFAFAESIETIPRDLQLVRPTVMSGVPRVFEKLRARIYERAREAPAPRRAIFHWAARLASRRGRLLAAGTPLPPAMRLASSIADRLVYRKIREAVGGRLRFAVSGSAPLDPDLAAFFLGTGLTVLEGYGLTETSPVVSVMPLEKIRFGTVGPPLPNVDVRLADDGEVLVRGPNVMLGYYNRPDDTASVIDDGWFRTGDIATFDEAGFLRLTDRKREVIVTSGGKKIWPQPIEQRLRQHPLVAEAVVVGDRRHFPAVLLVPDLTALAAALQVAPDEARNRLETDDVRGRYRAVVDEVNRSLAQFERIKRFALIDADLSPTGGLLTPTMKVKRRVFEERYAAQIDALYGPGTGGHAESGASGVQASDAS